MVISWVEIFGMGVILGANFPGGDFPGCEFSKLELSGGNHPSCNFPGESFYVTDDRSFDIYLMNHIV